jgi:murein DD-endopeptidase MepM/ murein hydrolase activator NlpD
MQRITLLLFLSFFAGFSENAQPVPCYKNDLFVDPAGIEYLSFPLTPRRDSLITRMKEFEEEVKLKGVKSIDYKKYLTVLFAYRDQRLVPIFKKIIGDGEMHTYFKCMAVMVLGQCGRKDDFQFLLEKFRSTSNDLLKAYLVCAMGKLSEKRNIDILQELQKGENNFFVGKTFNTALDRAKRKNFFKFGHLPLFDTTKLKKPALFPGENSVVSFLSASERVKVKPSDIPVANDAIYPHMQYKMSDSLYAKVRYPKKMFGFMTIGWGLHVGEDSGWLFAGMPVHSIMAGRVMLIQHEDSWGCLVCIESRLPDGSPVTCYYGHLAHQVTVVAGQTVQMGDVIGEIGPAFTLQNGGYLPHLHLGVEKAPFASATIAGYSDEIERWYNPVAFIRQYGCKRMCDDGKSFNFEDSGGDFWIK